ncbi:tRNA 1-methyladenosine methyltransferase subunit GCD14 [Aspergillus saccharolyticus JOP 1030-1]|uniref:tRNA (adenine(58)-N(1))-methyltransferase catalytic subunit TRM61 n=1 Tax=Aspergillus saccharolyticus JOP 1030-1 TaxID=1450539 RepID=A0A318ZMJ3_9EURO|nr:tRNA methyltransferase complex GCD14 subunit [Aspergillus saccharolyticus JOP 1030-1]PYH48841.1 tRNA methyltransferase complex GCD14 subunit [Aspergillus saccharolyticus JOP 1030-1]
MGSPFLTPGTHSQLNQLALLHLRRDQAIPTVLQLHDDDNAGYKEGKVTTTRFGSFPHTTLTGQQWGSQIIASKVDTGSRRGRGPQKKNRQLKRKADELDSSAATTPAAEAGSGSQSSPQAAVAAASGFLHLVYPTPELWTMSLPHRTQVVYTPDYSYILHRLRARPGSSIIEAGAGSGSFTHAAVRAVFNGYPTTTTTTLTTDEGADATAATLPKKRRLGQVSSFEFHEQRVGKVRQELREHGLEGLVHVTHRDVYQDGFLVGDPQTGTSPKANAVFLDLPAPWLALKHLVRHPASGAESPLDPTSPVYLCTFSPCLEQVQRTVSVLRQLSWLDISMVEVNNHRIDVKREKVGLEYEKVRGAVVFPKSVDEAVSKMRHVEEHSRKYRELQQQQQDEEDSTPLPASLDAVLGKEEQKPVVSESETPAPTTAALADPSSQTSSVPLYAQGRLVHRTEDNLKTHTSYLVFAVLPREWTEEDEQKCREKWPPHRVDQPMQTEKPKGRKQLKREQLQREEAEEQQQQQQQQKHEDAGEESGKIREEA